jgi:hypothetical protein
MHRILKLAFKSWEKPLSSYSISPSLYDVGKYNRNQPADKAFNFIGGSGFISVRIITCN